MNEVQLVLNDNQAANTNKKLVIKKCKQEGYHAHTPQTQGKKANKIAFCIQQLSLSFIKWYS